MSQVEFHRVNAAIISLCMQQTHLETQSQAREERGIESTDFGEIRSPFQMQLLARVQALDVADA